MIPVGLIVNDEEKYIGGLVQAEPAKNAISSLITNLSGARDMHMFI